MVAAECRAEVVGAEARWVGPEVVLECSAAVSSAAACPVASAPSPEGAAAAKPECKGPTRSAKSPVTSVSSGVIARDSSSAATHARLRRLSERFKAARRGRAAAAE